jgi:hypothetical protein
MKTLVTLSVLILLGFIIAAPISAQYAMLRPMMGDRYDAKTEFTIVGTIEKIHRVPNANRGIGMHLIVKSSIETNEVHLGPAAFIEKRMTFKEGDTIEIIGSAVTMMGRTVVIAREVKKDEQVLKLRDETGIPLWSRGHRPIS